MARPRLFGEQGYRSVNVYLTEEAWERLLAESKTQGVSKSAVIRSLLTKQQPKDKR